jgi:uncharacterized protein
VRKKPPIPIAIAVGVGVAAAIAILSDPTLSAAPKGSVPTQPDAAYRQDYEKWKVERIDDLKQNWLNLAGLFWLQPGANAFGTDPANAIVLPRGSTAAHAGSFDLENGHVTIRLAAELSAKSELKILNNSELLPDASGKPTIVELGSLRMKVIKRGQRLGIRVQDLASPNVNRLQSLIFFPLDMNYRVVAKWIPSDGKKTVAVPNVLGDINNLPVPGTVEFSLAGQQVQLTALSGNPLKSLFFVFSDPTAKTDTYPGGRFLDAGPVSDGTVVIDFNRAYNPPCAVTPYATCPLAPKENRLAVAIPVGEKYDRTHGHH